MPNDNRRNNTIRLSEVAEALGVSIMTVSRAINNKPNVNPKTRKLIVETAEKMGYTPNHVAKSLVSSRTYTIGVVIPEISHSFFPEVVRGIEEVAHAKEYQIFLTNTSDRFDTEKKVIDALRSKRVDGILVSSSLATDEYSFYAQIAQTGPPMVFFDRCIQDVGISCIRVNDHSASRQITEHLIGHGYTKIGFLGGYVKVSIGKDRYNGYVEAMKSHHLKIDSSWVVDNGFNEKSGYQGMQQLLDLPLKNRPRAVVAVNDPVAFGAMDAIRQAGLRIPDDVAIVGFTNDIRAELVACPVTTVHQPAYELGKKAASKLIRTIESKDELIESIEIITRLVVRKSCGC